MDTAYNIHVKFVMSFMDGFPTSVASCTWTKNKIYKEAESQFLVIF